MARPLFLGPTRLLLLPATHTLPCTRRALSVPRGFSAAEGRPARRSVS
jgi:hypothetical protein